MVIIHREKLVVIFLTDFVTDDLSVNNGGHLVFPLCLCRLYGNLADLDLPTVFLLTIPAFVFVEQSQVTPVHRCADTALYVFLSHRNFRLHEQLLFLPLPFFQFIPDFGMQADGDALFAVEPLHCYLVGKVRSDNAVQQFQTLFHGLLLNRRGNQRFYFLFRQVIDHIGIDTFRLHGQRPLLGIHDQTV